MQRFKIAAFRHAFLLIPALLLSIIALGFQSVPAGATDTTHCSTLGTLKRSIPIGGKVVYGYLNVYYNSSNGYNCAKAVSTKLTDGVYKSMSVDIFACKESRVPAKYCTATDKDADKGSYAHYAGPVGVYAPGHCITAHASIIWKNVRYTASMPIDLCG